MKMHLSPVSVAYWTVCWRFLTPAVLLALLVASWINFGTVDYGDYVYPLWVQGSTEGSQQFKRTTVPAKRIHFWIQIG